MARDILERQRSEVGSVEQRTQQSANLDLLADSFGTALRSYAPVHPDREILPADAFYLYRLLLGRNPDPIGELPDLLHSTQTFRDFLSGILRSDEFSRSSRFFPANHLLMAEVEGFRFWFNTSDREMGVIMALGTYEPALVGLLRRLVRPGMRCVDLGAQTGFFTCLLATLVGDAGQVLAFEPMPASHDLLLKNVRENHFAGRVQPYRYAGSDESATTEGSLVSNMYVMGQVEGGERVRIEAVRLDDVIHEPVDIIKVDVEGHEPAAIRGMRRLIAQHKPVILSEANEHWLRSCSNSGVATYLDLLVSLGYEIYEIGDLRRPLADGALSRLDLTRPIDVIAIPRDERGQGVLARLRAAG